MELPGIDDPQRAEESSRSPHSSSSRSPTSRRPSTRRSRGSTSSCGTMRAGAPNVDEGRAGHHAVQKGLTNLFAAKDSTKQGSDSTAKDSAATPRAQQRRSALQAHPAGADPRRVSSWPSARCRPSQRYLDIPAVKAALPPGQGAALGKRHAVLRRRGVRPIYVVDARPIITGELPAGCEAEQHAHRGHGRRVRAEQRRRPPVPHRDGEAHPGLHGDRARRPRHGTPAGHQQRDRHARPDHDGEAATCRRRRTSRSCCAPARSRCRSRSPRSAASARALGAGLDSQGIARAMMIAVGIVIAIMIGYYRFSGLLAVGALVPVRDLHAGGARRLQRRAHAARASPASCCRSVSRSTPTC